ncbi:MAG: hypothetical protein FJ088_07280 [Deltaproteobacteria bacterium]|nr:hypothetical protein [Deltaproteobacteria bacterium]
MSRKNLYVVMVAVFIFACSGKDKKVDIVDIADEAEASADIIEDNETFTEEDFTGYEMAEVKDSLEISKDVPPKDVPNDIAVPMCCGKDFPCPSNMTCAGSPEINKGSCKEKLTEQGKCWSFENCGEGEGCVGANLCPCDALCDMIDTPGECVKLPGGCCNVNGDCDEGFVCVQESFWLPGKCLTDPNGPECPGDFQCCWEDSDCGGGAICMGAYACGCIELCPVCGACAPDKMGVCTMTYEYNCCVDGYKCVPGQKCYNPGYNGASTCMKTPAAGQCWNNSDCAYDEECKLSA